METVIRTYYVRRKSTLSKGGRVLGVSGGRKGELNGKELWRETEMLEFNSSKLFSFFSRAKFLAI